MSKIVIEIPGEMVAKATEQLADKIKKELSIPDPDSQKAEASIREHTIKE